MSRITASLACVLLLGVIAFAPEAQAEQHVRVPHVVALDVDAAVERLEALGLEPRVTWRADLPPGRVATQEPGMNTLARLGTAIHLVVGLRVRVETLVPDVQGLTVEEAVAGLEAVYEVQVSDVPSRPALAGRVVAQRPVAGSRLAFRGTLHLDVGRARLGRDGIETPAVAGLELAEAERVLLDLGFVPHPVFVRRTGHGRRRPADAVERLRVRDRILTQDPIAGALVASGAEVRLTVALSRPPTSRVRLPSLQGLGVSDAESTLRVLGFQARVQRIASLFTKETVVQQIPATGAHLRPGSVVQLVVGVPAGRSLAPARVLVPDLHGAGEAEAWERARSAGIRLVLRRRMAPERPVDQVLAQHPTAGARVPLGSVLRVDFPLTSDVPRVLGLSAEDAAGRVEGAGLAVVFVGDDSRVARARVVDQSPEAGERLASGTAVRVVLRSRSNERHRLVRVPDLTGLGLAEAQRVLAEAGLQARPSFARGGGPAGVTGQAPAPGALVLRGMEVRFTVRRGR